MCVFEMTHHAWEDMRHNKTEECEHLYECEISFLSLETLLEDSRSNQHFSIVRLFVQFMETRTIGL